MLNEFIEKLNLSKEDADILLNTCEKVKDKEEFKNLIKMIEDEVKFSLIEPEAVKAAEAFGINQYTFYITLFAYALPIMKKRYDEKGISEKIFWDSVEDFKYKIKECHEVYDVFGVATFSWYQGLFTCQTFKLGRLEFCCMHYYTEGEYVVAVHIPSCGALKYEDVLDSYKRAYNFFDKTHGDLMAFSCGSWLLNPEYMGTVFKEGSNIYKFASDYNIFLTKEDENFHECWRIFGKYFDGNIDNLPTDTSLQKALVKHLKEGKKAGSGMGAFMFDGEKVYKDKAECIKYLFIK